MPNPSTPKIEWQSLPKFSKPEWKSGTGVMPEYPEFVPKVVADLVAAFQRDMTVIEACDYAKIPRRTFYNRLKSDPAFREIMEQAKRYPLMRAKERGFEIIDKGSDRDAGPMIRWLLEKRQPEIYAPTKPDGGVNNTQNNYFFLTHEDVSVLTKQSDIINSDPSELLEALEASPNMDTRPEEEGSASLYPETP